MSTKNSDDPTDSPEIPPIFLPMAVRILPAPPVPGAPAAVQGTNYARGFDLNSLSKPHKRELGNSTGMLRELAALAASRDWTQTFGALLPTAEQTLGVLQCAIAWTNEASAADKWATQSRGNAQLEWHEVLQVITLLKPMLQAMFASTPTLVITMPATADFIQSRSQSAKAGVLKRTAPSRARARAERYKARADKSVIAAQAIEAAEAVLHPPPPSTAVEPASEPETPTPPANAPGKKGG